MKEATPAEPVCGNCGLWKKIEPAGAVEIGAESRGWCHALPPVPFIKLDARTGQPAGQGHTRPCPLASESCSMYMPRAGVLNG